MDIARLNLKALSSAPQARDDDDGMADPSTDASSARPGQVGTPLQDTQNQTFPGLLLLLHEYRFSGVLVLKCDGVQTNIYLSRGSPVFVELGRFEHSLGQLLLRSGRITKTQYMRTIKRMSERCAGQGDKRMGECLVELGFLTPAEVYEVLKEQLHEKIIACFRWEPTRCELRQGSDWIKDVCIIESKPVEQLILEGVRRHFDHRRLEQLLEPFSGQYPRWIEQSEAEGTPLAVSGQEQRFIRMIDGSRTLAGLIAAQSSPLSAMQLLGVLWLTRRLVFSDRPEGQRPRSAGATGITDEAPDLRFLAHQVMDNVELSTTPTHRDTPQTDHHCFVASSWVREWYFDKLGRLILRQSPGVLEQQSWDQRVTRARQAFWVGQQFLRNGRLHQAGQWFQQAIELDSEEQTYKLLSAWTEYQLAGPDRDRRMLFGSVARDLALKVFHENRSHAKAHCILGHFLRLEKEDEQAVYHLQQAINLDASDHEARRELEQLKQKQRQQKALAS